MPTKKRIVKPSKKRKVIKKNGYKGLIGFLVATALIVGSFYFMAREYSKGPFANLLATTIGVKRIPVDADDGTIVPKTPDINITTDAYEAMQEAQKPGATTQQKEVAKTLIKADVEATAVTKTAPVKKPVVKDEESVPEVAPIVVIPATATAVTCSGLNDTKYKVGDTVVGPLISGTTMNGIHECQANGSWKLKMCPTGSSTPCTEEQNPGLITIKPTYMLINEGLANNNATKFNCNKGGVVYASGSQILETKEVCQGGKWVTDTAYIEALVIDCKKLGREWVAATQTCKPAAVAAGKCDYTTKCYGSGMLTKCAVEKDGKLSHTTTQCPSKACASTTACTEGSVKPPDNPFINAPPGSKVEKECSENRVLVKVTEVPGGTKSYIEQNCSLLNPSKKCDPVKKECVPVSAQDLTTYICSNNNLMAKDPRTTPAKLALVKACKDTEICDEAKRDCVAKLVTPEESTYKCSGNLLQKFNISARLWQTVKTCDSKTQQCDADKKECTNLASSVNPPDTSPFGGVGSKKLGDSCLTDNQCAPYHCDFVAPLNKQCVDRKNPIVSTYKSGDTRCGGANGQYIEQYGQTGRWFTDVKPCEFGCSNGKCNPKGAIVQDKIKAGVICEELTISACREKCEGGKVTYTDLKNMTGLYICGDVADAKNTIETNKLDPGGKSSDPKDMTVVTQKIAIGSLCAQGMVDDCDRCEGGVSTPKSVGSPLIYCGTKADIDKLNPTQSAPTISPSTSKAIATGIGASLVCGGGIIIAAGTAGLLTPLALAGCILVGAGFGSASSAIDYNKAKNTEAVQQQQVTAPVDSEYRSPGSYAVPAEKCPFKTNSWNGDYKQCFDEEGKYIIAAESRLRIDGQKCSFPTQCDSDYCDPSGKCATLK